MAGQSSAARFGWRWYAVVLVGVIVLGVGTMQLAMPWAAGYSRAGVDQTYPYQPFAPDMGYQRAGAIDGHMVHVYRGAGRDEFADPSPPYVNGLYERMWQHGYRYRMERAGFTVAPRDTPPPVVGNTQGALPAPEGAPPAPRR